MKHYYTGKEAALGWFAVGAVVVAYELVAPDGQLLSEGIDRALIRWPVATRVGVALVACHLLNLIPTRVDPLHRLAGVKVRRIQVVPVDRSQAFSGRIQVVPSA